MCTTGQGSTDVLKSIDTPEPVVPDGANTAGDLLQKTAHLRTRRVRVAMTASRSHRSGGAGDVGASTGASDGGGVVEGEERGLERVLTDVLGARLASSSKDGYKGTHSRLLVWASELRRSKDGNLKELSERLVTDEFVQLLNEQTDGKPFSELGTRDQTRVNTWVKNEWARRVTEAQQKGGSSLHVRQSLKMCPLKLEDPTMKDLCALFLVSLKPSPGASAACEDYSTAALSSYRSGIYDMFTSWGCEKEYEQNAIKRTLGLVITGYRNKLVSNGSKKDSGKRCARYCRTGGVQQLTRCHRPLSFDHYVHLARVMLVSLFNGWQWAHAYLVLCWNLIARCVERARVCTGSDAEAGRPASQTCTSTTLPGVMIIW